MSDGLTGAIKKGESETLEFKKSTAQIEKALKAVCAFLNHKGGTVYFGIDGGKAVGQEVSDSTLKSISQKIRQRIKPEISPEIEVLEIGGKKVIEVKVKAGNNKPFYLDGIAYKRVGSENVAVSPEELERIILEKRKKYWDSEICEGATPEDVDDEKVKWFLRKAKYERNLNIDENIPAREALEKLELLKEGKPANAAILLFGKNPQKFFLQAEIRCAKFKGTEAAKPFLDMRVLMGTLFEQIDAGERFVLDNIKKAAWIEPGKIERQEKWEYPPDAIREAITNAICHRDYEESSNVQVRIFDDRIEVWGCGPLPAPLTPEDLKKKHRSVLRNPLIARCLFMVKFVEHWGTGTNKMVDLCVKHGLPEPLFEEVTGSLVVTFRKYHLTDEILNELNERQKKALEYLKTSKRISRAHYASLLGCSARTAFNDLQDMVSKKTLQIKGKGKGTHYELA